MAVHVAREKGEEPHCRRSLNLELRLSSSGPAPAGSLAGALLFARASARAEAEAGDVPESRSPAKRPLKSA